MADNTASVRQKALAEKKRRLEELKARRRAAGAVAAGGGGASSASTSAGTRTNAGTGTGGLDEYIDGLLNTAAPAVVLIPSEGDTALATSTATASLSAQTDGGNDASSVPTATAASVPSSSSAASGGGVPATVTKPKVETFEIAIQTEEDDFPPPSLVDEDEPRDDDGDDDDDDGEGDADKKKKKESSEETKDDSTNDADGSGVGETNDAAAMAALSTEERAAAVSSEPFRLFLASAPKRVERLLGAPGAAGLFSLGTQTTAATAEEKKEGDDDGMDFATDYATRDGDDDEDEDEETRLERERAKKNDPWRAGGAITAKVTYDCPAWTAGRDATDMDWCPGHKELILTAYHRVSSGSSGMSMADTTGAGESSNANGTGGGGMGGDNDPATRNVVSARRAAPSSFLSHSAGAVPTEGLVAVWNLAMPHRPEHLFTSGSPVLRAKFHPSEHPRLIVGGTQAGQILVWDARAGKCPVQRSDARHHSHALVGMEVLTDDPTLGHALVTADAEGKVHYWSASDLREPVETVKVEGANFSGMSIAAGGYGVVCGDERGALHGIFAPSSTTGAGSSAATSRRIVRTLHPGGPADGGAGGMGIGGGIGGSSDDTANNDASTDEGAGSEVGHFGMVTAVAARSTAQQGGAGARAGGGGLLSRGFLRGASGLLVTTGVDWTTKLWAPAYKDGPLMSFLSNSYDYMCDAQWSPSHPSVFATASSNGNLHLWNLANSIDQPMSGSEGIPLLHESGSNAGGGGASSSSSSSHRRAGINRIKWSADGRRIAVASGDKVHVLSVSEEFCKGKGDEEGRVMHNLISRGLIEEEKV